MPISRRTAPYKSPDSDSRTKMSLSSTPRTASTLSSTASFLLPSVSSSSSTSRATSSFFILVLVVISLCSNLWLAPVESALSPVVAASQLISTPVPTVVPEIDTSSHQLLKRAPYTAETQHTSTASPSPSSTRSASTPTSKPTMSTSTVSSIPSSATSPTSSSIAVPSPVTTPLPDTKGDTVLFGRPAVIAGYNLTTGILVNGAFFLIFSIVIVIATVKRAQFRRQFRRDIEKFGSVEAGRTSPGGKGGKGSPAIEKKSEKHSGDALSKQTSTSKQRLMDDIGPGGMQNTHIADANRSAPTYENRSEEHRQGPRGGAGVRFGESERYVPAGGRTGQQLPRRNNSGRLPERSNSERSNSERNAHAQQGRGERRDIADPLARYQDEPQDRTDYSLPPLTASTIDNSYKPARVIQAYEDYNTPQAPRPTYQQQLLSQQQALSQPRPLQPVKRSNSNRTPVARSESSSSSSMPVGLPPSARAIERANSRPRITTQGLADLSGSSLSSHSGSSLGSYANSPADRYGRSGSRGGSPVVPIEMDAYPTPIARSNSARLPTQMRVGGGGQAYDGSYA